MVQGEGDKDRPKRRKGSKVDEEMVLLEDLQRGIMKLMSAERVQRMSMLQRRTRSQHHPGAPHYSMGYTGSEGGNSVYQEATGGDVAAHKKPKRKESANQVKPLPETQKVAPKRK